MIELDGPQKHINTTASVVMPYVDLHSFDAKTEQISEVLDGFNHDTLLLHSPQYFMALGKIALPYELSAKFVQEEAFGKGRHLSMNGVYFGQLIVSSKDNLDLPELVAVKPHIMGDPEGFSVMKEWAAHNHMNGISTSERAYMPLALWKNDSGMPQLVTQYDHSVQTYDNVFGLETEEDAANITPNQIYNAFNNCMYGLGLLHGAGVAHGDAKVKNLGTDRRLVRFVDLEEMELLPLDESKAEEAKEMIENDLGAFVASTVTRNGFNDHTVDMTVNTFDDTAKRTAYIESYARGLGHTSARLGITLPPQAQLHESDILRHFDMATELAAFE